jgi:hypothetical protein
MDCVIIGPSDVSSLSRFGKIPPVKYSEFVSGYALFLSKRFDNVIVAPDDGVYSDVALEFGKLKGKKPIAFFPDKDSFYGVEHIKPNFPKFDLRPINGDWYSLNADLTKKSLCVLCLGFSPGVLIEIAYIKYHQKWGSKKEPKLKNIHLFIDSRCIKDKLPEYLSEQINNIFYFKDLNELGKLLEQKKHLLC